jgi:hypothetical protein
MERFIGTSLSGMIAVLALGQINCGVDETIYRACQNDVEAQRSRADKIEREKASSSDETAKKLTEMGQAMESKDRTIATLEAKLQQLDERNKKIAELEERLKQTQSQPPVTASDACAASNVKNADEVRHRLLTLTKREERRHVRASIDEHNCFTDRDLESFIARDVPARVVKGQMKNLRELATGFCCLTPQGRDKLINDVRATFSPTWGELGGIRAPGQTNAGQAAEQKIAEAIADAVESECKR